jgi:hypothetical protein
MTMLVHQVYMLNAPRTPTNNKCSIQICKHWTLVLNSSIPICDYWSSCLNVLHIDDKRFSILVYLRLLMFECYNMCKKRLSILICDYIMKNKVIGNWPCNYSRSFIFNHYNTPMKKTFILSMWLFKLLHIRMLQHTNKKIYKWLVHHHGATCY